MNQNARYAVAFVFFALARSAAAEVTRENVLAEFDVPKGGGSIIVPILSGGKRYQFLLDTGLTCTCFNERHRQSLGERVDSARGRFPGGTRYIDRFAAPPMTLGGLPLESDGHVTVLDLTFAEDEAGRPVDGMLGMDVLRHLVLNIDFDVGKVRVLRSAIGAPGRATPIIWHERPGMREGPFIAARIDGRVVCEFLLDTGAILGTLGTMDLKPFDDLVAAGSLSRCARRSASSRHQTRRARKSAG